MIHNYIESSVVVGEVYSNYAIKSSGWESNAPMWIFHALGQLGINRFTLDRDPALIEFLDNRFMLPEDCTLVTRLHIFENGNEPDREDFERPIIPGEVNTPYIQRGSWIHVPYVDEGFALIKYKSFPAEYNEKLDQIYPLIPNDENLKKYLREYLLMQILMNGYSHPIYNLTVNNPWVNPQFMIEKSSKKAKISVGRMDALDRHKVSKMIQTFISPELSTTFYINDINQ